MLQITDAAAEQLSEVLADLDTREDVCLRISETQEGIRMVLDQQRPGDATIKNDDETLLVMDAVIADRLDGRTMDFNERTAQLVFT
jgi:Fe-S cluster assembly iron-binding protein IscA